jgi:hypothetical protein
MWITGCPQGVDAQGRQVQTSAQLSMIEADALIRHLEDQAKEAAK